MKYANDRIVAAVCRAWCVGVVAVIALAGIARAGEPVCQASHCDAPAEVPFLARIPYLNRLFITVGAGGEQRVASVPAPGPTMMFRQVRVETHADCGGEHCACCTKNCAAECECAGGCKCCACAATSDEPVCGEGHRNVLVLRHPPQPHEHAMEMMEHIAGLMAGKAAAEASLDARREADERMSEIIETLADLMADNAALDAKLKAHAEHQKLQEKIAELTADNVRLKVQAELAAERAEARQQTLMLTLENERLHMRLAELEKHSSGERTSERTRGDRRQR